MRCKVGDLALVLKAPATPHLVGLVCEVIRRAHRRDRDWFVVVPGHGHESPSGGFVTFDFALQPLRNPPGDDETLTWAGKPQETPADVIREVSKEPK